MERLLLKEYTNGKKYLCKTSKNDWENYKGSGNSITEDLVLEKTTLLGEFETREELKPVGLYYSDLWNVVNDDTFLNQTKEEGQGGYTSYSEERNRKISSKLQSIPKTESHKKAISNFRKGKVACKDIETGKVILVSKEEFEKNKNLVGLNKNRPNSEKQKKLISEKLQGRFVSEETRQKLRGPNPNKGHGKSSKRVMFFGEEFEKMKDVLEKHKKSITWFYNRIESEKYPDCYYL